MNFNLIDSVKDRLCEARKKVTYRQRGAIETRKANKSKIVETIAASFNIDKGEVLESALFEKIVRDCRGEEIRRENVRRLRKVGSDEWFSLPAQVGNKYWSSIFNKASDEDAILQGKQNIEKAGIDSVDTSIVEKDVLIELPKKPEQEVKLNEIKTGFEKNKKAMIGVAVAAVLVFAGYKLLKSQ